MPQPRYRRAFAAVLPAGRAETAFLGIDDGDVAPAEAVRATQFRLLAFRRRDNDLRTTRSFCKGQRCRRSHGTKWAAAQLWEILQAQLRESALGLRRASAFISVSASLAAVPLGKVIQNSWTLIARACLV